MSIQTNKQLILDFYAEVLDQRNIDAIPTYFVAGSLLAGSLENMVHGMSTSFPDYQITLEEVIAEDDKVVVYTTLRGTHMGDLFGHSPTGKYVHWTGIHIYTIKDDRIISYTRESDRFMLFQQLGITPAIDAP